MSDGLKDALLNNWVTEHFTPSETAQDITTGETLTADQINDAAFTPVNGEGIPVSEPVARKLSDIAIENKDLINQAIAVAMEAKNNTLAQGAKYDSGKPMLGLLPTAPMVAIGEVLTFGAKKYAAHNWRKGIKYSRVYDALQRHLLAFNEGVDIDEESKLKHLAHAGCCLMFLLEYQSKPEKYAEFDDRYKGDD